MTIQQERKSPKAPPRPIDPQARARIDGIPINFLNFTDYLFMSCYEFLFISKNIRFSMWPFER